MADASLGGGKRRKKRSLATAEGDVPPPPRVPILTPVEVTLEPATPFHAGSQRIVRDERPPSPRQRVVLPPRERHTVHTLSGAAGDGPFPLIEMLVHNNMWHEQTPEDALRGVAAHDLFDQALRVQQQQQQERIQRGGGGAAPAALGTAMHAMQPRLAQQLAERGLGRPPAGAAAGGTPAQRLMVLYQSDREARELRFFAEDVLGKDELAETERRPDNYPMFRVLRARYGAAMQQRRDTARTAAGFMPRRECEVVPRDHMRLMRLAPDRALGERPCSRGVHGNCLFTTLAHGEGRPEMAYVAREFLLPSELSAWNTHRRHRIPVTDETEGAPRPCIDCLLFELKARVHSVMMSKEAPVEQFNTFTVLVGPGEYGSECMLDPVVGGDQLTGIYGHVPSFSAQLRAYVMQQDARGHMVPHLAEVGMDFWRSLSEANACLGARKAQPLIGGNLPRLYAPPTGSIFLPRRALEAAAGYPAAWMRFLRSAPTCVLADRVLLCDPTGAVAQTTRVPAAWLRRFLHLPLPEPLSLREAEGVPSHEDAAFGTYERCVALWLAWATDTTPETGLPSRRRAFDPIMALWRESWALPHVQALPLPPGFAPGEQSRDELRAVILGGAAAAGGLVLWSVCLWRWAVALQYEHQVRPWATSDEATVGVQFAYQARLFRDTHLDMLTHALRRSCYYDDQWLASAGASAGEGACVLRAVYPQCNRVCSVEELPNMGLLLLSANPWFDKGNKKAQNSILQALQHVFLLKVMPQKCQRRQFDEIVVRHNEAYPGFRRLVRLTMRAMMLGNVPGAVAAPPLVARLRINAALSSAYTTGSSVGAGECDDAALDVWIGEHPMTTLFMLREYFCYTVERDLVFDRIFGAAVKWTRFKETVRLVNGDWRAELTRQTHARGVTAPMNWDVIEVIVAVPKPPRPPAADGDEPPAAAAPKKEGGGGGGGKKVKKSKKKAKNADFKYVARGRINTFHDKLSTTNIKLKKGCVLLYNRPQFLVCRPPFVGKANVPRYQKGYKASLFTSNVNLHHATMFYNHHYAG